MTANELANILIENPSFIFSLQTKVEEQEKEIQKLKDLLGIQTSSADLNIKAVNKIKEQAKEIEQLKQELALVKASSMSYETWWIKYRDMAVELDKELKELLKKVNEK